jgi:spore coat polysaccharide biosynthesis protein SpsF
MLRTLGIVQACDGSPRFHGNLRRRLGGHSLLGWVVRRVTESLRLDGVIVLAHGPPDDRTVAGLVPPDVPVFVSPEPDALGRFLRAIESYPADAVVRVRGDTMFIDPGLIDRLITTAASHPDCDYITYCSRDGQPAIFSPVGMFAEWFPTSVLRRVARANLRHGDRDHFTRHFFTHPETYNVRLIPAPVALDRDDVRLTVDIEEDWDNALAIIEALGPERLEWQRIAALLDQQPALRRRMADLNRAQALTP